MGQAITPVNITAAALVTQFVLVIIAFVTTLIMRAGEPPVSLVADRSNTSRLHVGTLTFGLLTLGCLLFSDQYTSTWKPLFPGVVFPGLNWSFALKLVFLFNIVWVTWVVAGTGGSMGSPFAPIYFTIPALAIFLREPSDRILLEVALVILGFTYNLRPKDVGGKGMEQNVQNRIPAYWVVSVSCMGLATAIGYVTRPK